MPYAPEIHQSAPGKCPKCGMDLLPEGTSFGMLRHMVRSTLMLTVMVAIMVAAMAAFMMLR